MKIIDMLDRIAKGEEAPKKFKYKGEIYIYRTYTFEDGDVMTGYGFEDGGWLNIWRDNLNDEVEIIEEDKKIEKLESYISCGWNGTCKDLKREDLFSDLKKIGNKINEIIDYINGGSNE